jgi:hypothetical protein
MWRHRALFILVILSFISFAGSGSASSFVKREGGRVYIVDQGGELWDVTQAESLGFKPEKFQYGIGRNAFSPLDDSYLSDNTGQIPRGLRIIGVADGSEAKAYSVSRLRSHEISNSEIGSKPIAVGY